MARHLDVATPNGTRRVPVYPSPVKGLVIHRPLYAKPGARLYVVTHAATGYVLSQDTWPSRRLAGYAAWLCADLADWSLTDPAAVAKSTRRGDTPRERWRALRAAVDLGDIRA